jgi:hypothetical protein
MSRLEVARLMSRALVMLEEGGLGGSATACHLQMALDTLTGGAMPDKQDDERSLAFA